LKTKAQNTLFSAPQATQARPLDQFGIKSSRVRLVICGDTFERYSYEFPYFFNKPPDPRSDFYGSPRLLTDKRRRDNLRCARQRLRRIVSTNVSAWGQVPKFVTYTFSRNVTDLSEANRLWNLFSKRFSYEFGSQPYLTVVEFQKRGAVHYHTLYFGLPFTQNLKARLSGIWGHGFVHVKGIAHVHNVSHYVTKYLQKDLVDSRLNGRKAFFCSRGLKRPVELRDETDVALAESSAIMSSKVERVYSSAHFGRIHYTQGVITRL